MQKIISRSLGSIVVAASVILLAGCYVTAERVDYRQHSANCKKVERIRQICVKSQNGHCRKWKQQTRVYWHC
jgi:hypothetical protein